MYRWVLDTNVLSLMFKHQLTEPLRRAMIGQPLGVTYVQIGEITKWTISRNWGLARSNEVRSWVKRFPIINGDSEVAETWGEIVAHSHKRGRPTSINDSWIAACCLTYDLPLVTLNTHDFADFAEFEGLELIS
jgi:predicted nucleic acid-binding protein